MALATWQGWLIGVASVTAAIWILVRLVRWRRSVLRKRFFSADHCAEIVQILTRLRSEAAELPPDPERFPFAETSLGIYMEYGYEPEGDFWMHYIQVGSDRMSKVWLAQEINDFALRVLGLETAKRGYGTGVFGNWGVDTELLVPPNRHEEILAMPLRVPGPDAQPSEDQTR